MEKEDQFNKTLANYKKNISDIKAENTAMQKEKDFQLIKLSNQNEKFKEENEKLKASKAQREIEIMKREEDLNKKIDVFLKKEAEARMAVTFFTQKIKDKDQRIMTLEIQVKHLENHVPASVIHKVEAEVKQAVVMESSESEKSATPKMATAEEAKFMKALNDLIKDEPV